jgi:hypothetical protein
MVNTPLSLPLSFSPAIHKHDKNSTLNNHSDPPAPLQATNPVARSQSSFFLKDSNPDISLPCQTWAPLNTIQHFTPSIHHHSPPAHSPDTPSFGQNPSPEHSPPTCCLTSRRLASLSSKRTAPTCIDFGHRKHENNFSFKLDWARTVTKRGDGREASGGVGWRG